MSDTLPLSLLKNNHKLVFEKAIGIREALDRAFNTVLSKDNIEIIYQFNDLRLPFIFTWIHTIITERNRFRPYGWAEDYEFNENDLLSTIKSYYEYSKFLNSNDEKLLIISMKDLILNSLYGSKIENSYDYRVLE